MKQIILLHFFGFFTFSLMSQNICDSVLYGGKWYHGVQIGSQCWMRENLDIGTFVTSTVASSSHTNMSDNGVTEKYCYGNNTANCDIYGGLYDWNEMMQYSVIAGTQGICPSGWHVPTDGEWQTLVNYLGGDFYAACKLKESGLAHWASPNFCADNSSGYTALPGALRLTTGSFLDHDSSAMFWTSSKAINLDTKLRYLDYNLSRVIKDSADVNYAFSVRCIKDDEATGENKNEQEQKFNIFPNPVSDIIIVDPEKVQEIEIFDCRGMLIINRKICNGDYAVDVSGLASGVYLVNVKSREGSFAGKMVKN